MDYDRLTEDEFMRLLAAVDRAESALHAFRASLLHGGTGAADARENYKREHQRLENFMTRVQAKQIFGKEAAV